MSATVSRATNTFVPAPATFAAAAPRWRNRTNDTLVRAVRPLVSALARRHAVRLEGVEHLPAGPALLVGNHGLLGYETPLFFEALVRETGRLPVGLADRWFFRVPGLRDVLVRLGGTYGDCDHAHHALTRGELVVCYPGGAREVLKRSAADAYQLRWERRQGFARVALAAGVPIIPFAAAGVDDTFEVVSSLDGTGQWLMGDAKYDLPVLNPLTIVPRPVPIWFRFGAPIHPGGSGAADVAEIHRRTWSTAQSILDDLVAEWRCAA